MEKLMLAIDDTMFPLQKGTCLYLSKPDIPHPFPEAGVAPLSTGVL